MGGGGATMVFVLVIGLVLQAKAGGGGKDVVHKWCKITPNYDLCTSIIKADPRTQLKQSPNGMCVILRDRAVLEVIAADTMVSRYLNNKTKAGFNKYGVECLQECAGFYGDAIYDLDISDFTIINQTTYTPLSVQVGSAYDGPKNCEECFTERPGTTPSPLTSQNHNIQNISQIILSILYLLGN
ncbi:hypothetical protein C2S51_009683 [Perilla frutescens var. frutescens]|nr:hypothetical protein C2S51_009683 [Perilla frutescens var. frutescens]